MKNKILLSIGILLVLAVFANTNNKKYIDKSIETNSKSLAVYLQNDTGAYNKSTSIPLKNSGYSFNNSLSVCDGSTTISWDNELWGLELDNISRENTKCYLYFDKN